jgi:hypothetical protein
MLADRETKNVSRAREGKAVSGIVNPMLESNVGLLIFIVHSHRDIV